MSEIAIRPPRLSTRYISANNCFLSSGRTRLSTQLDTITSMEFVCNQRLLAPDFVSVGLEIGEIGQRERTGYSLQILVDEF